MSFRPALLLLCFAGLSVALTGCAHVEPSPCASDRDCKLNRLCDAGHCVWPAASAHPTGGFESTTTSALPLPQYAIEPAQAMFRFGPTHRGRSPFALPANKPVIWWAFPTGGPIVSSPAIAGDGSVLVGSQDNRVFPSPVTGRSSGRMRRGTSSSARPPWRTTGPSTSAPTTITFTH